jgi:hypothetical protein
LSDNYAHHKFHPETQSHRGAETDGRVEN